METNQRITELCQLLRGDDAPVTEWYKNLTEAIQDIDPLTAFEFADMKEKQSVNMPVLPQLFHLLRQCLLNHRWSEALQVLQNVVHVPIGSSQTVWKVGTELLSMEAEDNRDLIQQLFSQMKVLSDLDAKEVVMEFVVYLLKIGDDAEATTVMQEVRKRHGLKKVTSGDREKYMEKLHKAYLGLLWYLEWKKYKKQCDELSMQRSGFRQSDSLSQHLMQSQKQSLTMQIKNFSDRAISCFKELEGYPGVWDIFVTKHAELLVCDGKQMDAFSLLKSYCDNNGDSLNAHKYLYDFCQKHFPEHDDKIWSLKIVAQLSPSDGLVLDLCSQLIADGDICSAVPLLFNLLDYSCWQAIEQPWRMMSKCLKKIYKQRSESEMLVIQDCWTVRESWWSAYHFTRYTAENCRSEKSLMLHKAVVASLLCGKDNEFVVEAMKYLTEEEKKVLP
ncbi:TATA box-binding protein-associated factor RNA polymerase I subunit A-like [Mercenaria mercenaria]|uniref:TATA box-binding protein-associated factor RNA polymerase I subunit A-like n=1 Tax=Mercenaria mercenaria TaxID=6596 RepID=UPI00234EA37C|nr:TATA box-binding protein-associated factor RNA polymerase I subunit A-like [Mercenaria mercenaria]